MIYFSNNDLLKENRIKRLNLVNSITGIKPANLIGSISSKNETNLAIFSSIVHLGSNPALIGFIIRPMNNVRRHTYENIKENGFFTINHIHPSFIKNAHFTSAKFKKKESEFSKCNLEEEYLNGFKAPFVKESGLKIGLTLTEEVPIKSNGCVMIIGKVIHLYVEDNCLDKQTGMINLEKNKTVGIGGLNAYYSVSKIADYEYARVENNPFSNE